MLAFFSSAHSKHSGLDEVIDGILQPCPESANRADAVLAALRACGIECRETLTDAEPGALRKVHDSDYVDFVAQAWNAWTGSGQTGHAVPRVWPRHGKPAVKPESIDALLGMYSSDALAPLMAGTYDAALASAQVAFSAADAVRREGGRAFALCRPPGHHAGKSFMGGFCYFNNSAVAAQHLLDTGSKRVGVLDVDYHHGNGTQDVFYDRGDVLCVSIHADTKKEYPFYRGMPEEVGVGAGEGMNLNLPLPMGSGWQLYRGALASACERVRDAGCDALVVALGLDTAQGEPLSTFQLTSSDFETMGASIAQLALPTVIVLEGGYGMTLLATNVVAFLRSFDGAATNRGPATAHNPF